MNHENKLVGYYNYTVILTYAGMISGFIGIINSINQRYQSAVICLMVSGICDMFDGVIASTRVRNEREKRYGIQIDSLSDLICFGLLPAIFVYCICHRYVYIILIGAFYILCALIRLAYYNVSEEDRQKEEHGRREYYVGLPVTTIAISLPICFIVVQRFTDYKNVIFACLLLIVGTAFVLPVKIKKLHIGKHDLCIYRRSRWIEKK